MEGIKKITGRMQIKNRSAGPWDAGEDEDLCGGVCPACGEYDIEFTTDGFCRNDDCKRERLIKALHNGEAMMTKDGVLFWMPGVKVRLMVEQSEKPKV